MGIHTENTLGCNKKTQENQVGVHRLCLAISEKSLASLKVVSNVVLVVGQVGTSGSLATDARMKQTASRMKQTASVRH